MLAAGSTGDSQQEIIDALTGQEGITPKSAFNEYFNMRKFLTHESNKYQLNIGMGPVRVMLSCGTVSKLLFKPMEYLHEKVFWLRASKMQLDNF